jgi:PiT family inorganic phosphate transporter
VDPHAFLISVILISCVFTYTNGFQDGSSVAATAIATKAIPPYATIFIVALFEFMGAYFGGSAVAQAIRSITSYPDRASILPVLASGLTAAIFWNYFTRAVKIPSSSTHALIGGILGAVITESHGAQYITWGTIDHVIQATGLWKVIFSLFLSPLIGFGAGYLLLLIMIALLIRANRKIEKVINILQLFVTSALAFGHGANDTQKAMGLIVLALNAVDPSQSTEIPNWVRILSGSAMAFGVISFAPGIVKRIGQGIFKVTSLHALTAQAASAIVVLYGSASGGPISASQVIASSVIGVGAAQRGKGVHWLVARDMLAAWFFTIPGAAIMAFLIHSVFFHWLELLIKG